MNGAALTLGSLSALALAAELRPASPLVQGSGNRTQRAGLGLLLVAGAAGALLWFRRVSPPKNAGSLPLKSSLPLPPLVSSPSLSPAPSPSTPPLPFPSGDAAFYSVLLQRLGAPETPNTRSFLLAWRQAEGGSARYNPFNTTQKASGATDYNSVGVKHYPDPETGLAATLKTLLNPRYTAIVDALRRDAPPVVSAAALRASPWGTGAGVERVLAKSTFLRPPAIAVGVRTVASLDTALV